MPATTVAVPTREESGQAAARVRSSGQGATAARLPTNPGGREIRSERRRAWPSGRWTVSVAVVEAPAAVGLNAASSVGANAGGPQPAVSKLAVRVTGLAGALQGVSRAVAVWLPQPGGAVSTALSPPRKRSAKLVNGSCGRSSKTAVI